MLIDSHAHLNFPDFEDNFEFPDVSKIVVVGTSIEDSRKALELSQKHDHLFATVGIHPDEDCTDWKEFEKLARNAVGIGECGLDFSRKKDLDRQHAMFSMQIEIAKNLNLPLILHVRDAQDELISHFGHSLESMRGVFHCFSGDENYLHTIIHLFPGFYVSFAGNITYKSSDDLRRLVSITPLERMLVETDSPFLSPEPHRGKRNTPASVKITTEKIASIKGASFIEIAEYTRKNAERLFKI